MGRCGPEKYIPMDNTKHFRINPKNKVPLSPVHTNSWKEHHLVCIHSLTISNAKYDCCGSTSFSE
jgi:hypothetical protein